MGKWVILIGDRNLTIDRFQNMKFVGNIKIVKDEHYIDVFYENGYAHFCDDADNYLIEDYDPSEIEKLPFRDIKMIMLKYSDTQILKDILGEDDFPKDVVVDCDGLDFGLDEIIGQSRLLL